MSSTLQSPSPRSSQSPETTPPLNLEGARTPLWARIVKWVLILAVLAFCFLLIQRAIDAGAWLFVVVGGLIAMSVLAVYSTRRAVPMKYLLPGLLLMLFMQVYPIGYTVATSFTNYNSINHRVPKAEAIVGNQAQSVTADPNAPSFKLAAAVPEGADVTTGELSYILSAKADAAREFGLPDDGNVVKDYAYFVAENGELAPLSTEGIETGLGGTVKQVPGKTVLNLGQWSQRVKTVEGTGVASGDWGTITRSSATKAIVGKSALTYDEASDTLVHADGTVYRAKDGNFVSDDGKELPIGYVENVGLKNYKTIFNDPTMRSGFLKIFIWNIAFAFLSVATTFLLGMMLALLFNDPRIRGKGLFRSILILPYAIPSFVTALVWGGMFNQDFGLINRMLSLNIDWLGDPWAAKAALLITNLWLGFPYMFLICTGALQAIPADVKEAAAVDGAGAFRTLRSVTMPLLLVAVGPLLVASFSFNFNNFGIVYLLTKGGPSDPDNTAIGQTDLLITFAYRLAEEQGGNIALAAAVSVVIFVIVGLMSAVGFKYSKALEEVN